MKDNNNSMS